MCLCVEHGVLFPVFSLLQIQLTLLSLLKLSEWMGSFVCSWHQFLVTFQWWSQSASLGDIRSCTVCFLISQYFSKKYWIFICFWTLETQFLQAFLLFSSGFVLQETKESQCLPYVIFRNSLMGLLLTAFYFTLLFFVDSLEIIDLICTIPSM